jgi:hypothetical protein
MLPLLGIASPEPPARVLMVYGNAIGLLGNPMIVGRLTVIAMAGVEADPAKLPLAT